MLQSEVKYASVEGGLSSSTMETMGDRIKMLREAKGLTQDELARRLTARDAKVSSAAVSQWERGETTNLKIPNFLALIEELGTNAHYLWFGRSDPTGRDSSGKFRRSRPAGGTDSTA